MGFRYLIRRFAAKTYYPHCLTYLILVGLGLGSGLLGLGTRAQSPIRVDSITGVAYRVETYHTANFPVGMAFAPDGRLFYNEKTSGSLRVISADGVLQPRPVITVAVDALQERGMLGLALDPDFATNGYIYLVYTAAATRRDYPANKLIRVTERNGIAGDIVELFSVPITNGELIHNGGNIHFDAAGYLYLSLGDYNNPANAQDLRTPQGAIHRFRVTASGIEPAPDNPFGVDNSIFAYGLRNPFDFTFDPLTNRLFAVDVGHNCDDELNLILAGFNYGWRKDYACVGTGLIPHLTLYVPPLISWTPVISPTGLAFYDHPAVPEWQGHLFICDWNFGEMQRIVLDENRTRVVAIHKINLDGASCRVDLVVGADGALYFGSVGDFGGKIFRLVPVTD